MGRRLSVPIIGALVALLAVVLVAPGLDPVSGAIPNAGGTYSACLTKASGAVKVINYPKVKCAKGQRLIKWNQKGPAGAPGAAGAQGAAGATGAAGITKINLTTVVSAPMPVPSGETRTAIATCPAGKAVGGGYSLGTDWEDLAIEISAPHTNGWQAAAFNWAVYEKPIFAFAVCMTTEPGAVIARLSPAAKKAINSAEAQKGKKKGR